jgi:hypothetical protein
MDMSMTATFTPEQDAELLRLNKAGVFRSLRPARACVGVPLPPWEGDAAICRQILELRERLGAPDALDVLRTIMNDPETRNSDRINA